MLLRANQIKTKTGKALQYICLGKYIVIIHESCVYWIDLSILELQHFLFAEPSF
jgi:hypothetical protein